MATLESSFGKSAPLVWRDPSRARTDGAEFEFLLVGLCELRLRQKRNTRFLINANLSVGPPRPPRDKKEKRQKRKEKKAQPTETDDPKKKGERNPFDDLFIKIVPSGSRSIAYLLQLKQNVHDYTIYTEKLADSSGHFSIRKYFNFYKYLRELLQSGDMEEGLKEMFQGLDFDDFRFVIFTPNVIEHSGCRDVSHDEFPYIEIFSTGDMSDMFVFGEEDDAVWRLFEDSEDCALYQQGFLPKLLMCSKQARPKELEGILSREFSAYMGCSMSEIMLAYTKALKVWWNRDEAPCYWEGSADLEETVHEVIDQRVNAACTIYFEFGRCIEMVAKLSENQLLNAFVPGITAPHRSAKINQILRSNNVRVLHLTEKEIANFNPKLLHSICKKICDFVVVDVDSIKAEDKMLVRNIVSENLSKVIIMTSERRNDIVNFCEKLEYEYDVKYGYIEDPWKLEDLTEKLQAALMDRWVTFQSQKVRLGDLEGAWTDLRCSVTGAMLDALFRGDEIFLGGCLPSLLTVHLPRTISHRSVISDAVFTLRSDSDFFVLSGFSEDALEKLCTSDFWEESFLLSSVEKTDHDDSHPLMLEEKEFVTKWIVHDSSIDQDEFLRKVYSENASRSVHWLRQSDLGIIWKGTHGNSEEIKQYVKKMTSECQETPICSHRNLECLLQPTERVKLLLGEGGMGKTSFATEIARILKEHNKTDWIVMVHLRNFPETLEKIFKAEERSKIHILEMLEKAAGCRQPWEKTFLQNAVEEKGSISVLIDGVDEMCPRYKREVINILKGLLETKVKQIWVTSRFVLEDDLKNCLQVIPFELLPFTVSEQVTYLLKHWQNVESNSQKEYLRKHAEDLVLAVKEATAVNGRSLCDLPLHTYLLAVTYENEIIYNTEECMRTLKEGKISTLSLHKNFVQSKLNIVIRKSGISKAQLDFLGFELEKMERDFTDRHMICAAYHIFYKTKLSGKSMESIKQGVLNLKKCVEKDKSGIITSFEDDMPQFAHQSFAEFFAAAWMKENFREVELASIEDLGEAKAFFNAMMAEGYHLHEAASAGRTDEVSQALEETDVNARDAGGRTSLHLAGMNGHTEVLELLLSAGADDTILDDVLHWTPLRYVDAERHLASADVLLQRPTAESTDVRCILDDAAKKGLFDAVKGRYLYLTRLMISRGVPTDCKDERGDEALHYAAAMGSREVVELLLQSNCKVAPEGFRKETPLHRAAINGNSEICSLLIEHKASLNDRDADGMQPLHSASLYGDVETGKILLEGGADICSVDRRGFTPLHISANRGRGAFCRMLLERSASVVTRDSEDLQPLHHAATIGNTEVAEILLQAGADIDSEDKRNRSPAHIASRFGHGAFTRFLIKRGARVDKPDCEGLQLLHHAAMSGDVETAKLLLVSGADIHAVDHRGRTPLQIATQCGHESFCHFLIRRGAEIGAQDAEGASSMHHVALRADVKTGKTLLQSGANVHSETVSKITPLHAAAGKGSAALCRLLLQRGASVEVYDAFGMQPLHHAAMGGDTETGKVLLAAGASFLSVDGRQRTPLHISSQHGRSEFCKLLLRNGAKVNKPDGEGMSPLHLSAINKRAGTGTILLEAGADVHAEDKVRRTPLHAAANQGDGAFCRLLLRKGAAVRAKDNDGMEPIHHAALSGDVETGRNLLFFTADVNAQDGRKRTALLIAAQQGKAEFCHFLLQRGAQIFLRDSEGMQPIHHAAANGDVRIGEVLLECGCDIESKDGRSRTPLHVAANNGRGKFCEFLIQRRADKNARDAAGAQAIHHAALGGDVETGRILLESGADIHAEDWSRQSALHVASSNGNVAFCKFLVEEGADITAKDLADATPLHHASVGGDVEVGKFLLQFGIDINMVAARRRTPLHLAAQNGNASFCQLLLEHGASSCAKDADGREPLHHAAFSGDVKSGEILLDSGASIQVEDERKQTALHIAALYGKAEFCRFLLGRGTSVEAGDAEGMRPLHRAVMSGDAETAMVLLDAGSSIHGVNLAGQTPLHLAMVEKHDEIFHLLLRKLALEKVQSTSLG